MKQKKVLFGFVMLAVLTSSCGSSKKSTGTTEKRENPIEKSESTIEKMVSSRAKELKQEGWVVSPGALPLEIQLERTFKLQMEVDDKSYPKYITGEGLSIGANYDAAKMQATELAKQELAGRIQTEVTALIENSVANQQLPQEDAASITKTVLASKNLISQSIGRTIILSEMYKILPNKNRQVSVWLGYNSETALEGAKNVIREELEKQGNKLHDQLDNLLNIN